MTKRGAVWLAALFMLVCGNPARADYTLGRAALERRDFVGAAALFLQSAEAGDVKSQSAMGEMYERGRGVPQNFVEAHKWYNLAASRGDDEAEKARDRLAQRMSPDQLAEAQRLASAWRPNQASEASSAATPGRAVQTQREPAAPAATELWRAAELGDAAKVKELLRAGVAVNSADQDGWTALFFAAFLGHADVVQELLRAKARVDLRGKKEGETPLILAALGGHAQVVRLLLNAKANAGLKNKAGLTARDIAERRGYGQIAAMLTPKPAAGSSAATPSPASGPQQRPPAAQQPSRRFGPILGQAQLGMTLEEFRSLVGSRLKLHEEYSKLVSFTVEDYMFHNYGGTLKIKFNKQTGRAFEIDWQMEKRQPTEADKMIFNLVYERILDWGAIKDENRRVDNDWWSAGRTDSNITVTAGISTNHLPPHLKQFDRYWVSAGVLGLEERVVPESGESPIRDQWAEHDVELDRWIAHARSQRGIISAHHALYNYPACGSAKRGMMVFWSEGNVIKQRIFTEPLGKVNLFQVLEHDPNGLINVGDRQMRALVIKTRNEKGGTPTFAFTADGRIRLLGTDVSYPKCRDL